MSHTKRNKCLLISGLLLFACAIIFLTVPSTTEVNLSYAPKDDAGIPITTENVYISGAVKRYHYKPMHRYFFGEVRIGDFVCTIEEAYPLPMNMLEHDHDIFSFGLFGSRHGGSIVSFLNSDKEMIIGQYDSRNNEITLRYNADSKKKEIHLIRQ